MRATSPITGVYSGLPALGTNVYLGIPALGTKVYPGLAAPVAKAYTFRCGNKIEIKSIKYTSIHRSESKVKVIVFFKENFYSIYL